MPGTPSVRDDHVATTNDTDAAWLQHFSCPPEEVCDDSWMQSQIRATTSDEPEPEATLSPRTSYPTPPSSSRRDTTAAQENVTRSNRIMGVNRPVDVLSPAVSEEPVNTDTKPQTPYIEETPDRIKPRTSSKTERRNQQYTAMDYEAYSSIRIPPTYSSSFMRPGSKFQGTQTSERQKYDVLVEIKQVDMRESYMCGFLRIQGLTEDHPTLTTFFEGEIIGEKYSFLTSHPTWGSDDSTDLDHWAKFKAFLPIQKTVNRGNVYLSDNASQTTIFMRWKEHFLVPDHKVKTLSGASFDGFYYIAFDQVRGEIDGIYFHAKSEKYEIDPFQQLKLLHIPDRGTFSAFELA